MGALGDLLDQLVDQYDCLYGLIRSVGGLLPSHNDDLGPNLAVTMIGFKHLPA